VKSRKSFKLCAWNSREFQGDIINLENREISVPKSWTNCKLQQLFSLWDGNFNVESVHNKLINIRKRPWLDSYEN
jgi:hypothetical protein